MAKKKLPRLPLPHAEVTERVIRELRAMSVDEVRETFVQSGILLPGGGLAPPYDGSEPLGARSSKTST